MDSKLKIKPVDYSVTNSPILNDYFGLFYLLEKAVFCFCFVVVFFLFCCCCLFSCCFWFVCYPTPFFFCLFLVGWFVCLFVVCFVLTKSMPVDGIAYVSAGD